MELSKECTKCKITKNLSEYTKGNSKYGKCSRCRICHNEDHRLYKQRPENHEREMLNQKRRRAEYPQERKTDYYNRRKEYYAKWKTENNAIYRQNEKAKSNRRRNILQEGPKLTARMISILEFYNVNFFNSDDFTCEYCKMKILGSYHLDHIIPVCKGGTNLLTNLAISCIECNGHRGKGKKLLIEWKPELQEYIDFRNSTIGL